ncbi:MAG: ergothioneine biosynthesis protein EgtB [Isosphaerales bacterium]
MPTRNESDARSGPRAVKEPSPTRDGLGSSYLAVRKLTERLAQPLGPEDCQVQSMPDASPVKWHLAHTSWFFETFVLAPHASGYQVFHPSFNYLFNSYYNAVGDRLARPDRGLITRPTLEEVYTYRRAVDHAMHGYLEANGQAPPAPVAGVIELGLNHEQQHQELILTDIKHALAQNPLRSPYRAGVARPAGAVARPMEWRPFAGGVKWLGHAGGEGFAFDNEGPRHRVYLEPFLLGSRLVTSGEFLAFIQDGGYRRPELWLSDGWNLVRSRQWEAPLYWERIDGDWWVFTLGGLRRIAEAEPVCHVSYYEADAFARWAGARLPTEAEWESAAGPLERDGNLLEAGRFHPRAAEDGTGIAQCFGDAWEWTQSPYVPYPGSRPMAGALGEYNAKFMCNQQVLRGGSCATPATHIRATYRNFFPPESRWQFTGIRLAKDE